MTPNLKLIYEFASFPIVQDTNRVLRELQLLVVTNFHLKTIPMIRMKIVRHNQWNVLIKPEVA